MEGEKVGFEVRKREELLEHVFCSFKIFFIKSNGGFDLSFLSRNTLSSHRGLSFVSSKISALNRLRSRLAP